MFSIGRKESIAFNTKLTCRPVMNSPVNEPLIPDILRTGNGSGRKPIPLEFTITRELTLDDLFILDEPKGTKPDAIQKIRNIHHRLAHLLAQGKSPTEVAALTGYTSSRITVLKRSPAFEELIAFYAERETEIMLDTTRQLQILGGEAVAVIHERLETNPDAVPVSQLIEIGKFSLDRSGNGPSSTQLNVDVPMSEEQFAELMKVAKEKQNGSIKVIEGRATEVFPEAQDSEGSAGSKALVQPLEREAEIIEISNQEGPEV